MAPPTYDNHQVEAKNQRVQSKIGIISKSEFADVQTSSYVMKSSCLKLCRLSGDRKTKVAIYNS